MDAAYLPTEVLEDIIDMLSGDIAFLQSIRQTCRALSFRGAYYYHLHVCWRVCSESQLEDIVFHLKDTPRRFHSTVRSVKVSDRAAGTSLTSLLHLLRLLPSLRILHVEGHDVLGIRNRRPLFAIHRTVLTALARTPAWTTLQRLSITSVAFISVSALFQVLETLERLDLLHLHHVRFHQLGGGVHVSKRPGRVKIHTMSVGVSLRRLKFCSTTTSPDRCHCPKCSQSDSQPCLSSGKT